MDLPNADDLPDLPDLPPVAADVSSYSKSYVSDTATNNTGKEPTEVTENIALH